MDVGSFRIYTRVAWSGLYLRKGKEMLRNYLIEEGERATDVCDLEVEGEPVSKSIFAGKELASMSGVAIRHVS